MSYLCWRKQNIDVMKNLVEQTSLWLQSEMCRSGNIIERTLAVISAFKKYITEEKKEVCDNTGLSFPSIMSEIELTEKTIRQILAAFLRGNQQDALQKTYKMTISMKFDKLGPDMPMYKCRENNRLFHFTKDEMFHIPYDKRHLVGNQRYSLSGLPCLYLGGSSYVCWEELGRKDFSTTNFCGYSLKENVKMFDFVLPVTITESYQIGRVVLILACSLAANRDSLFKPEYILSQCVLHSLIYRAYYNHSTFCMRYYSSHLLNGDADYFITDFSNKIFLDRYINYVFPAAASKSDGYSDELRKIFNQTDTVSLMHEILLKPELLVNTSGEDCYLVSQFGLMDAILDEKLGFTPKREEGELLLLGKK